MAHYLLGVSVGLVVLGIPINLLTGSWFSAGVGVYITFMLSYLACTTE